MEDILVLMNKSGTVEGRCALSSPPQVSVVSGRDLKGMLEGAVVGDSFFRSVTPPKKKQLFKRRLHLDLLEH